LVKTDRKGKKNHRDFRQIASEDAFISGNIGPSIYIFYKQTTCELYFFTGDVMTEVTGFE